MEENFKKPFLKFRKVFTSLSWQPCEQDRWDDFAARFELFRDAYQVTDRHAKAALWNAVTGRSSRLRIASLYPLEGPAAQMDFDEYLDTMGRRFRTGGQ
jgi:hypothetical protein